MIKSSCLLTILLLVAASSEFYCQSYDGPLTGSVDTGAVVTMNSFATANGSVKNNIVRNVEYPAPVSLDYTGEKAPYKDYIYVSDKNVNSPDDIETGTNFKLNSFPANSMTSYIPPDPVMAVGPNNVITCVNSEFSIWDRSGKLLKKVTASQWWQPVWPDEAGDPQVIYDHYENHWILCWMQVNDNIQTAGNLIAYSANEDPLGTWYMYRLDTKVHGDTIDSPTWGDYPHIGYDDKAIYITTNCFNFSGGFAYAKIRIINKSELYSSMGGQLTYTDIWNITLPGSNSHPISIQPAVSYSPVNDTSYFAWNNSGSADFYVLYRIINPLTNPVLVGTSLPVPRYYPPPGGQQLGGGTVIENLSRMSSVPIYRDGKLYAVHAIRNSTSSTSSSLKYFVVDVNTNSVIEQVEQGAAGYYYLFPSITVDKDYNIGITYSRSANNEYIGAYYSTKLSSDPPGLSPSQVMVTGKGNYDVTFGGSTNRWGDYLSAGLDPVNQYNIWFFSEYAARGNTWGTWLTEIRMKPYTGASVYMQSDSVEFKSLEIGTESDTGSIIITNYGEDPLVIQGIPSQVGPFTLLNDLTFPLTMETYDSLKLEIEFNPDSAYVYRELLTFDDNDPNFAGLTLKGIGYQILPSINGTLYASTGVNENGKILTISKDVGAGTELGPSYFEELSALAVDPVTNTLYGISTSTDETELVRINASGGGAFTKHVLDIGLMTGIAFDTTGTLYGVTRNGDIYTIDLLDGSYELKTTATINVQSITINPLTNELWASPRIVFGYTRDRIEKIDIATGADTLIGETGFNIPTNSLAFDENGNLYGIIGSNTEGGSLISIDTSTALGTLVGEVGFQNVVGLAYAGAIVVSGVEKGRESYNTPGAYTLSQNYPNPFNPSTSIKFSVPVNSNVKLTVYNLLGQVVKELANEDVSADNYSVKWSGEDNSGLPVSSGIYFYELRAKGDNGSDFSKIMKMVYLK